jgi:hypothetical protein
MSTTNGEVQEWAEPDYDKQGYETGRDAKRRGRISWSHTSDTVAWEVDGQSAYIMPPAEFRALQAACAEWGDR